MLLLFQFSFFNYIFLKPLFSIFFSRPIFYRTSFSLFCPLSNFLSFSPFQHLYIFPYALFSILYLPHMFLSPSLHPISYPSYHFSFTYWALFILLLSYVPYFFLLFPIFYPSILYAPSPLHIPNFLLFLSYAHVLFSSLLLWSFPFSKAVFYPSSTRPLTLTK